ncbi:hypothetical protein [Pedobacter nutrimenti]|uniref:hypothetical protein n=1 Tax=Pedobacter nutrimenti TaxID=1241337 RepID=UPI0029312FF2|nr:hypothetical protein [Pedobacter nutrimenti]
MEEFINRGQPVIDIAGIKFYADAASQEFIEVGNTNNRIPIVEMMHFPDHSEFLFDHKTKNAYQDLYSDVGPDADVQYVWVRPISALDPGGMELLIEQGKYQWAEHYLTPLPTIHIGGTEFYIDEIRKGFREVDNKWNVLLYTDTNCDDPWTVYFDKNARNVPFPHEFDIRNPPGKLPDHISVERLPSGMEIKTMLRDVITAQNEYLIERPGEKHIAKHKKGKSI